MNINIGLNSINEVSNNKYNINFIYNYKLIKIVVAIVLLIFLFWMSASRISNINETFIASLQKETEYEFVNKANLEPNDKFYKIAGKNILVYKNQFPKNLQLKNKDADKSMYVVSANSEVLKIKDDGYKGFWWDLGIISIILSLIYFGFIHYYKKLLNSHNSIKEQLAKFKREINTCQDIKGFIKNYDNILKSIREIPYVGNIWWEFCETLIIQREEETDNPNEYHENNPIEKLKNTDQIEVYINSEVIIDKQTPKEVFDTIPGILTGLGLVGTFLAIAIALMGFDMGHIELSIQNLLGGLSIKFISSLAGIATSILFLFAKSNLFAELEAMISEEQNRLNNLFPRRTTESYLCYIWQQIEESQKTLNNLELHAQAQEERAQKVVEDLGNQISNFLKSTDENGIKEVLDMIAKRLGDSVTENLKEYMEELKKTKKESSTKALEDILGKLTKVFTDGSITGAIQEAQQATATSISTEINNSITNMSTQNAKLEDLVGLIGQYINQLQGFESRVEGNYSKLIENMDTTLSTQKDFIGKNEEYIHNLSEASTRISSTSSNLGDASEKIISASNDLRENLQTSNQIIATTKNNIENILEGTKNLNNTLVENINKFDENTKEKMVELFSTYSDSVRKVCGDIQSSVADLADEHIEDLKESIDKLNDNVNKLISERV